MSNPSLEHSIDIIRQERAHSRKLLADVSDRWEELRTTIGEARDEELIEENFCPEGAEQLIHRMEKSESVSSLYLSVDRGSSNPLETLDMLIDAMNEGKIKVTDFYLDGISYRPDRGLFASFFNGEEMDEPLMDADILLKALKAQKFLSRPQLISNLPFRSADKELHMTYVDEELRSICAARIEKATRLIEVAAKPALTTEEQHAIGAFLPVIEDVLRMTYHNKPYICFDKFDDLLLLPIKTDPYFKFTPEQLRHIANNIAVIKADASLIPSHPAAQAKVIAPERTPEI